MVCLRRARGQAAEEALGNPNEFLEFAMADVYSHLELDARHILAALVSVPGAHTQAELAFLTDMDVHSLQVGLQSLLTTNFLLMESKVLGTSFESRYTIADMARMYLETAQAPSPEIHTLFVKKRNQLIATKQQLRLDLEANRYSFKCVHCRSDGDAVIAKVLLDAYKHIKQSQLDESRALIEKAKQLAPDFFEVHRFDALLQVELRNFAAARTAYEAAIELEPSSAPLRLWFSGFLLRYVHDADAALLELTAAQALDPEEPSVLFNLSAVYMYTGRFGDARRICNDLFTRTDLPAGFQRKLWDQYLQTFKREAEMLDGEQHDQSAAVVKLREMKDAFERCPILLVDEKMRARLKDAASIALRCYHRISNLDLAENCRKLREFFIQEGDPGSSRVYGNQRGIVVRVIQGTRPFGFITCESADIYFSPRSLADDQQWGDIREGAAVLFDIGRNYQGPCAANLTVERTE
jgi:tetratricopeptide (TPR) repeat protein/cold shock CspA family protein